MNMYVVLCLVVIGLRSCVGFGIGTSTMTMRVPLQAGNWKCNPLSVLDAVTLANEVRAVADTKSSVEVVVIPPHPFLDPVRQAIQGSRVKLGAQDVYVEDKGAYTGAVSAPMLKSMGVEYVLCGHSERRSVFQDSDVVINRKVHKVLDNEMKPILCIGESKEEYEAGLNKDICAVQLGKGLSGVTKEMLEHIVVAYEPVWAIGTGLTATPEIAQSVHSFIRGWLTSRYGQAADKVRIQYGGSVSPDNVDDLMSQNDIDGSLVGGASLVGPKFGRIIDYNHQ
eukprot:497735_1